MNKLKITALAAGIAQILIYGDIEERTNDMEMEDYWWWYDNMNVDAKSIIEQLSYIQEKIIHVRMKSNGGNLIEAFAIRNAFANVDAEVTFFLDSVIASAATVIPMIKKHKVIMASNALLMIHAPSTGMSGNAKDLRETADILDKYSEVWASNIAEKTGKSIAEIESLLKDGKDHYYTAQEALEFGFVDEIGDSVAITASALPKNLPLPEAWLKANQLTITATVNPLNQPQGNAPMPPVPKPNPENNPTPVPQDAGDTTITAKAKETERQESIKALFSLIPETDTHIHALKKVMLIDASIDEATARKQILAKIGENQHPVGGSYHIQMGTDERDNFSMLVNAALSTRAGLEKDSEKSRVLRGSSLLMLAEKSLNIQGVATTSMTKQQIVAAAFTHSTSDFGSLLANVAEKAMLKGYEEAQETFQLWTTVGSAGDFKPVSRVDLNTFPTLDNVSEGAEYKYGTIGDRGETVQIATYGKLFSITREAIINDDLNAFTKIPMKMGRAAIRTVGDLVYAILTANPVMADSVALFHGTHNNLLTSAAISTASVDAMGVAMGLQTDGGANARGLNIPLSYLICPLALRGLANTVRTSQYRVGDADTKMANTAPNIVQNTFEVIAEARLDAASSTNWYGAANPRQFDTVEVTYLDGIQTPYIEQQEGFTTDGAVFKVRIDAGVKALDFRTLAKNPN